MKIFTLGFYLAIIVALFPSASTAQTKIQKIFNEVKHQKIFNALNKKQQTTNTNPQQTTNNNPQQTTNNNPQQTTNNNSQQTTNNNPQQTTNNNPQLPDKNTNNDPFVTSAPNGLKAGDIAPNAVYIDADRLYPFNGGAAIVKKGDASALIDKTGKFIVPYNKYNFALQLHVDHFDGYSSLDFQDGIFLLTDGGAVNSKGKLIAKESPGFTPWSYGPPLGQFIVSFDKNKKDNLMYYMDAEGNKYVLKAGDGPYFAEGAVGPSMAGLLPADMTDKDKAKIKWGYKSLNDEWIVQPIYDYAQPFSDGLACVGNINEFGEMKYGYINKKGKVVIPFIYSNKPSDFYNNRPSDFNGGLAKVIPKDQTEFAEAWINKQGNIVQKFKSRTSFTYIGNGLYYQGVVVVPEGLFGGGRPPSNQNSLMDSTGKIVTPTEFLKSYGVVPNSSTKSFELTPANEFSSQFNDGKIYFRRIFVSSPREMSYDYGYVNIRTKKIMEGDCDDFDLPFSNKESKLALTSAREGYINEDGVFVMVRKDNPQQTTNNNQQQTRNTNPQQTINNNQQQTRNTNPQQTTNNNPQQTTNNNPQLPDKNKSEHAQILNKFDQWKTAQIKKGTYLSDKHCANIFSLEKAGYNGSTTGIQNIKVLSADINNDNRLDALVTFNPYLCDGGNLDMNTQKRILILSKGATYITDDTFIDKIEKRYKNGWFIIERVSSETFFGTYYQYKDSDARCCPSVKRQIQIDYKTGKLTFTNGK